MVRFLFWNLNKRDIAGFVREIAREQNADILILAECGTADNKMLVELNQDPPDRKLRGREMYQKAWSECGHLKFFTRFDSGFMTPRMENHRVSIRSLELPERERIVLAAAHLPSKVSLTDESQVFESVNLSRMIAEVERQVGHHRTVLLGDLNMDPYEMGMVGARGGLNAVMSRAVAARDSRVVQKETYTYFYNPMWNHLGDRAGVSGTFFFDNAEAVCYYWHMFDQVLLRPALLKGFEPEQVRIVTEVHGVSLLANGRPDAEMASDHLPVLLEMDF